MVRLSWTPAGSLPNVIVLHKSSAISTDPTQGTSYTQGETIDGATVIFSGTVTCLEHVVPPGSANYYRFYTVNNNYYSTGAHANVSMGSYENGEIVEAFAYTNGVSIDGLNGSNGWSSAWGGMAGTWTVVSNAGTASEPRFPTMSYYPAHAGNKIKLTNPGNPGSAAVGRSFPAVSEGTLYVAYQMAYAWDGDNKWCGLSLRSNNRRKSLSAKSAAPIISSASRTTGSGRLAYVLNPWSGGNAADTGNVYLIVGKYTFSTREFKGKASIAPTRYQDGAVELGGHRYLV
jgi:hypothetical protein